MLFVKYFKFLQNIELPRQGAAVKNRKAHAEWIFGHRKRGASGSNPRFGYKKIRNAFAFRITFWLPHGQRLRNAPCGRFSEQSLAQRSKIARRMPKGFLGTARGELQVRIRDLVIKKSGTLSHSGLRFGCPTGKDCETRPVGDSVSNLWRSGQKSQGVCRRDFWAPQEGSFGFESEWT